MNNLEKKFAVSRGLLLYFRTFSSILEGVLNAFGPKKVSRIFLNYLKNFNLKFIKREKKFETFFKGYLVH